MIESRLTITFVAVAAFTFHLSAGAQEAPQMPPRIDGAVNVDEHTSAPLQLSRSAELSKSAGAVWKYLTKSNHVAGLFDGVRSITSAKVGERRTVRLRGGGSVSETVVADDATSRTFAYSIGDTNPMGISDHLAVLTITSADERKGAVVTWNHYFNAADTDAAASMSESLSGALAKLSAKYGGFADHGSNSGFNPAIVRQTRILKASKADVWAVVADGFGDAHVWSSNIGEITVTDRNGDTIVGDQRACFIPAFNGETKETITQYDEEEGLFAYSIDQGMPPFVTYGEAVWLVNEIDRNTTQVTVEITAATAAGVPPQAIAFFRSAMTQQVGFAVDDAKYFIENDAVHPRKTAALQAAGGGH
ncbi:MAG: SRPBCC family protein [Pseudomonadota bacterium]